MDKFNIQGRIGEGAHGIVLLAKRIDSGQLFALKKVMIRRLEDGIPNTALREIKALQEIDSHPNIVHLGSVFSHGNGFVLVFDYMHSDLSEVLKNHTLTAAQVKSYMVMLLRGVAHCHDKNIMHRDLKPANLLISEAGRLKIADFGLARVFGMENDESKQRPYSHQVATRWYRAPELLYGSRDYDQGIDMWAVGCILAEMINNSPLFPGENDIDQLSTVFRLLGTPNPNTWPGLTELPDYNKICFEEMAAVPLEDVVVETSPTAVALLKQMLVYNSKIRIAAHQALLQPFFFTEPLPAHHSELPVPAPKSVEHAEPHFASIRTFERKPLIEARFVPT